MQTGERLNCCEKSELSCMYFVPKIVFWMMFCVLVCMHLIHCGSCFMKSIECMFVFYCLWDAKTKIITSTGVYISRHWFETSGIWRSSLNWGDRCFHSQMAAPMLTCNLLVWWHFGPLFALILPWGVGGWKHFMLCAFVLLQPLADR